MTKKIMTFVFSMAALLLASCDISDADSMGDTSQDSPAAVRYEGEWRIDSHRIGSGTMTVYASGFALADIPYAAILRTAMPGHTIECNAADTYVAPYTNIGYSQQAIYMRLTASQWVVPAVVDGKPYTAVFCMADMLDPAATPASATYSKVSGVYSMSFPLKAVRLLYADGQLCETVETTLQIMFASVAKI